MLRNERGSSSLAVGIVAAVVGVLIGFGVASVLTPKNQPSTTSTAPAPDSGTKAADLRTQLNGVLREHSQFASTSELAAFDGAAYASAVATQLDKNSNDLADVIGTYYGSDSRQAFYTAWKGQISNLNDYALASKKNDKAAMATASQSLTTFASSLSATLANLNPQFSQTDLNTLLADHDTQLKAIIDAYGAKDYATAFTTERTANVQVGKLADALASGIVKQYQSKF